MGASTYVTDSEVEIIDKENLIKFLEQGKTKGYKEWVEALKIEGNNLDFSGWDGWKIISYYYDEFVNLLRDLAVFVEGEVNLEFESHEEGGWFEFHDGKCTIHCGQMNWSEHTPEEMAKIPPLSKELQDVLVLRKL